MKKAPLVAEPLHRLIALDISGDGDSGVGAHAVGNACDALGWVAGDSVSCACYKIDPWHLPSLHLLYQVRGDQPRLKLINAPTLALGDEFPMNSWPTSENPQFHALG
jgi:hypothetical protein